MPDIISGRLPNGKGSFYKVNLGWLFEGINNVVFIFQ